MILVQPGEQRNGYQTANDYRDSQGFEGACVRPEIKNPGEHWEDNVELFFYAQ